MFQVGLMRGGVLLAEEPPVQLMIQCGSATLEQAFLELSAKQSGSRTNDDEFDQVTLDRLILFILSRECSLQKFDVFLLFLNKSLYNAKFCCTCHCLWNNIFSVYLCLLSLNKEYQRFIPYFYLFFYHIGINFCNFQKDAYPELVSPKPRSPIHRGDIFSSNRFIAQLIKNLFFMWRNKP